MVLLSIFSAARPLLLPLVLRSGRSTHRLLSCLQIHLQLLIAVVIVEIQAKGQEAQDISSDVGRIFQQQHQRVELTVVVQYGLVQALDHISCSYIKFE